MILRPQTCRLIAVLCLLTSCASTQTGDPATDSAPPSSGQAADSTPAKNPTDSLAQANPASGDEITLAYFEDAAVGRRSESAATGSPADFYVRYLSNLGVGNGGKSEVSGTSEGVSIHTKYDDGTSESAAYSDIVSTPAGVHTFSVEGAPLVDRIAASEVPIEVQGVKVTEIISYLNIAGRHIVTMSVTNGAETNFDAGGPPSFVDSNGKQVESTTFIGTYSVRPGATAVVAFEFPKGDIPAGTVYVDGSIDDFNTPASFVLKVDHLT